MKTLKKIIIIAVLCFLITSIYSCHASRGGIVPCPSFGQK